MSIGMEHRAQTPWTLDAFFAWQEKQHDRYELVDGQPLRMMAGASNAHNDMVINTVIALGTRLAGSKCRHFNGDGSVETRPGQIRRPDIGVECGPRKSNGFRAENPRLVAEVLSPTTRDFDTFSKVEEYKLLASLDRILLIDPNRPDIIMWSRDGARKWVDAKIEGLESVIEMPEIGTVLPLAEVYRDIIFPTEMRLVPGE